MIARKPHPSPWVLAWRKLAKDKRALASLGIIALIALGVCIGPWVLPLFE
jgi:hypothetical protein